MTSRYSASTSVAVPRVRSWRSLTVSVGALNGIAIVTGHELGHKHERSNRIGAMLALAPSFYTHFAVEHNFGHHKRVSTPEDPASSRMGESFWKFLPRTVIGGLP